MLGCYYCWIGQDLEVCFGNWHCIKITAGRSQWPVECCMINYMLVSFKENFLKNLEGNKTSLYYVGA